jgi:hypothetical protein
MLLPFSLLASDGALQLVVGGAIDDLLAPAT